MRLLAAPGGVLVARAWFRPAWLIGRFDAARGRLPAAGVDRRQRIAVGMIAPLRLAVGRAADMLLQRFEGAVQLLHRAVRASLAARVQLGEVGLPAAHCSARFPCRRPYGRWLKFTAGPDGSPPDLTTRKPASGSFRSPRPKAVNNSIQDRHG